MCSTCTTFGYPNFHFNLFYFIKKLETQGQKADAKVFVSKLVLASFHTTTTTTTLSRQALQMEDWGEGGGGLGMCQLYDSSAGLAFASHVTIGPTNTHLSAEYTN